MHDFDRRDALCWHSTPDAPINLYECTDPEHDTPKAAASRSRDRFSRETVVYYHGTGQFFVPITDRDRDMFGGSRQYDVGPCPHRHKTIEAAEECGNRLTDKAVAEWNRDHGIA
jgi:hypothetical protein